MADPTAEYRYRFTGVVPKRFPHALTRGYVEPGGTVLSNRPLNNAELEPIGAAKRAAPPDPEPAPPAPEETA